MLPIWIFLSIEKERDGLNWGDEKKKLDIAKRTAAWGRFPTVVEEVREGERAGSI